MIYLGDRLGLYEALRGQGALNAAELAAGTGLHIRWVLEWLRNQASAGLVTYEGNDRFSLPDEAAVIFTEPDHPFYLSGFFAAPTPPRVFDHLETAFQNGLGMTWDEHGPKVACMIKRMTSPSHKMLPEFLGRVDGLTRRLEEGAHVVDVGCGSGVALRVLAAAFPKSTFEGYDPSANAIELAQADTAKSGLTNITYHVARGETLPNEPTYDVVMTLDCMHDMTRPDDIVQAIRHAIKPDGVWIIKDIRCAETFEENLTNPLSPVLYGISVVYCMSAAMSELDGAGLGTMGFSPGVAQKMTAAGGFTQFKQLDIEEDMFNFFYAVRP
jgi:SAM-dependent methyltransferase